MQTTAINLPVVGGESGLAEYIDKINKFPYLSQEEEQTLANEWVNHANIKAAHTLVTSHLRLVVKIAHGFKGYGLPLTELISEGNIGLMQAVKKFDPDKGFRLSTYAIWWIKAAIQEYVLHSWSMVKIGTTAAQKKLFFGLRKIKKKLQKIDQTQMDSHQISEIASMLDVSEQDVIEMDSRLSQADQSLNAIMVGSDGNEEEMIDKLASSDCNQEQLVLANNEREYKRHLLSLALKSLNEREQDIILQRRLNEPPATLDDLSQKYQVSRERIRQIEERALEKMHQYVTEYPSLEKLC